MRLSEFLASLFPNVESFSAADLKSLVLKADYGIVKIILSDILFIEGLDNYLKIHLRNQAPVVVRMTLKALMEKLNEKEFIRVHRSYIVQIHVLSIDYFWRLSNYTNSVQQKGGLFLGMKVAF